MNVILKRMCDNSHPENLEKIKYLTNTPEFQLFSKMVQDFYTYFLLLHLELSAKYPEFGSVQEIEEKAGLISYLKELEFTEQDSITFVNKLYPHGIAQINKILNSHAAPSPSSSDTPQFTLYLSDINYLKDIITRDKGQWGPDIFKLLISFACFARANPHPNGWIKYDSKSKDLIFLVASCFKKEKKYKEYLTNTLHLLYHLDMRVVGSTQPIPCFKLKWMQDINPDTEQPVYTGPASQQTIDNIYYSLSCDKTDIEY